jgi:hypothetical protein
MENSTVHALLADLADSPPPPSSVDLEAAMAVGRRTLQRRRAVAAGAAALALVAVLGVSVAVVAGRTASEPGPASNTAVPAPTMPTSAPAIFDPAQQYAEPGWLPDGGSRTEVATGRDWLAVMVSYPDATPAGVPLGPSYYGPGITLMLTTTGHGIEAAGSVGTVVDVAQMTAGAPAPAVNGRPAQWLTQPSMAVLRWEYAPGAWALVNVTSGLPGLDSRQVAQRVASQVRYDLNRPILLPFATAAVASALPPLAQTSVVRSVSGWSVQVGYGVDPTADVAWPRRVEGGGWPLSIWLDDYPGVSGQPVAGANTMVDGRPARVVTNAEGLSQLRLATAGGVDVVVSTQGMTLPGGLAALYKQLQIDPAHWR